MKTIADALVYAVTFISIRADSDADDDVGALESIAGALATSTAEEKEALAAAANRALAAELEMPNPREEFVQDYSSWMQNLFGDEWEVSRRV
jgi:hypothetical protein